MSEGAQDLIESALDNLVKQFANPMDFLRELVQNSIDAGTPRIEVLVRFKPTEAHHGVAEIEVRDFGAGMDEDIIDSQLTKLFSSMKEGDRTSIGKFGIGFTSVFAIRPEAVRVLTSKHGENWEVVFHEDRSFEKRRFDGPVSGTAILVYKRMRSAKVPQLVIDAQGSLVRWCEHATTPIVFYDQTGTAAVVPSGGHDPFGAFVDGADEGITVNTPFDLPDAVLTARIAEEGVDAIVGIGPERNWGFFSGGLTLLRSASTDHLGPYGPLLGHLQFKVRSGTVEHTLTRDNVIQDEAWSEAMEVVVRGAKLLRAALLEKLGSAIAAGDLLEASTWQAALAADASREPLPRDRGLLLDPVGRSRSLGDLEGMFANEVVVAEADSVLGRLLVEQGESVVADSPGQRELLRQALPSVTLVEAEQVFCLCDPLDEATLDEQQAEFLALLRDFGGRATLQGMQVGLCSLGAESNLVYVEGREVRGLTRRPSPRNVVSRNWTWMTNTLRTRWFMVNLRHALVQELRSQGDVEVAAFTVIQLILHNDQAFSETAQQRLRILANRKWVTHESR